jgi:hypothetical protein
MEPAPTSDRLAERDPVPAHQEQQDLPGRPPRRPRRPGEPTADAHSGHGAMIPVPVSTPRMSESTSGNVDPRMSGRATKTMSNPPAVGGERARHASFMCRRARLRTTAPPTRRPETKPARTCPSRGRTYSTIRLPGARRPSRITRRTSAPRRSLAPARGTWGAVAPIRPRPSRPGKAATRRPARGPWPAGGPGSDAPPGSASGCGTRGSSSACGCSVGMCASLGPRISSGGWRPVGTPSIPTEGPGHPGEPWTTASTRVGGASARLWKKVVNTPRRACPVRPTRSYNPAHFPPRFPRSRSFPRAGP